MVQFHVERIQAWLDKGAIPSDTVVKLQKQFAKAAKAPVAPKAAPVKKATRRSRGAKKEEGTADASASTEETTTEEKPKRAPRAKKKDDTKE